MRTRQEQSRTPTEKTTTVLNRETLEQDCDKRSTGVGNSGGSPERTTELDRVISCFFRNYGVTMCFTTPVLTDKFFSDIEGHHVR